MTSSDFLRLHHVGGRGGDRRFPVLPAFEADVVNVLYDGDSSATEDMSGATEMLASRQVTLSYCIGAAAGPATLRILRLPAGSSLLSVDDAFFRTFEAFGAINFDMGAIDFSVERELAVDLTTLDTCVFERDVPPPDFLSLNTQGTEFDILRGADRVLGEHAIGVQCEVTFFELYRGQNSLDDLCRYLMPRGYWLCGLVPHTPYVPSIIAGGRKVAPPIGFRRGGICLQAEALFFKDPRHILAHHAAPHVDLAKGVYMAIVLGNYGLAYCYAALADPAEIPDSCSHLRFARAFIAAARAEPVVAVPDVSALNAGPQALRDWYIRNAEMPAFERHAEALSADTYTASEQACIAFGFQEAADRMREYRAGGMRDLRNRMDAPS